MSKGLELHFKGQHRELNDPFSLLLGAWQSEAAWSSGRRVGLAIQRPRVECHSNHYLNLFLGHPEFNRSGTQFIVSIDVSSYVDYAAYKSNAQI